MVPRGEGWGGDRLRVWDWHVHVAIFKMDNEKASPVKKFKTK